MKNCRKKSYKKPQNCKKRDLVHRVMGGQASKDDELSSRTKIAVEEIRNKRKEQDFFLNFEYEGKNLWFRDIFDMLKEQRYEEFEKIVQIKPNIINSITYENHFKPTLLIHALQYEKDDSIVEYLVKHKSCDVTVPDSVGNTAFFFAIDQENLPAIKLILKKDGSVVNHMRSCLTPLHYAVGRNNKEMVELFLQQDDINVDVKDLNGKTPDCAKGVSQEIANMIRNYRKEKESTG